MVIMDYYNITMVIMDKMVILVVVPIMPILHIMPNAFMGWRTIRAI